MPFRENVEFLKHDKFHFMPPAKWDKEEFNNYTNLCGRTPEQFCQKVAFTDPIDLIQFKPSFIGENLTPTESVYAGAVTAVSESDITALDIGTYPVGYTVYNDNQGTSASISAIIDNDNVTLTSPIFGIGETAIVYPYVMGTPYWGVSIEDNNSLFCKQSYAGSASIISPGILQNGINYYVSLEVRNYVSGEISIKLGSQTIGVVDTNGTHEFYGVSNGSDLVIESTMSQNFVGCLLLESMEVYEVQMVYGVNFFNTDGSILADGVFEGFIWKGVLYIPVPFNYSDLTEECKCIYLTIHDDCYIGALNLFTEGCWDTGGNIEIDENLMIFNATPNGNSAIGSCDIGCDYVCGIDYEIGLIAEGWQEGSVGVYVNGLGIGVIDGDGEHVYTFASPQECGEAPQIELKAQGDPLTTVTLTMIFVRKKPTLQNSLGNSECLNICDADDCDMVIDYRNNVDVYGNVYEGLPEHMNRLRLCGSIEPGQMQSNEFDRFKTSKGIHEVIYSDADSVDNLVVCPIPPYLVKAVQVALSHKTVLLNGVEHVVREYPNSTPEQNSYLSSMSVEVSKKDQSETYTYSS